MPRATIATDDFNRAAIGANWAQLNGGAGAVQITGSTAFCGTVFGQQGAARWVGAGSITANQFSSVTIQGTPTGSNNYGIGVIARASADVDAARDYYFAAVSDTTYLGKVVDGTITVLATGSVTWATNDRLEIECEGTEIRLCQNGAPVGGIWTVTDTSIATGLPGILALGDPGICTGDDWIGGNITLPGVTLAGDATGQGTATGDLSAITTVYHASVDDVVSGWRATGSATLADAVDEYATPNDSNYITSPRISATADPYRFFLTAPMPAGSYTLTVRAATDSGTANLAMRFFDASGAQVGVTSLQPVGTTLTTYSLPVTIAGATAVKAQLEVTT